MLSIHKAKTDKPQKRNRQMNYFTVADISTLLSQYLKKQVNKEIWKGIKDKRHGLL